MSSRPYCYECKEYCCLGGCTCTTPRFSDSHKDLIGRSLAIGDTVAYGCSNRHNPISAGDILDIKWLRGASGWETAIVVKGFGKSKPSPWLTASGIYGRVYRIMKKGETNV